MDATTAQRARAGLKKIQHQFTPTDEGKLFFAVVAQAIFDALQNEPSVNYSRDYPRHLIWDINRRTAIDYLLSDMPHALSVGVDAEWIRRVFKSLGIDFSDLLEMMENK